MDGRSPGPLSQGLILAVGARCRHRVANPNLEPCLSMLSELSTAVGVLSECCRWDSRDSGPVLSDCCRTAVGGAVVVLSIAVGPVRVRICLCGVDRCRSVDAVDCRSCRPLSTAVDRCRPLSVLSLVSAVDGCPSCCPTQRAPRSMPQPRGALQQLHSGHSCVCQRVDVRNVDLHQRAAQYTLILATWDAPLSRGAPWGTPPLPHGVAEYLKYGY